MTRDGKLVILAGGISSRMKSSSAAHADDSTVFNEADLKPKTMIGVGKDRRPFLDYLLYNARNAGYRDVLIVIGEHDQSARSHYGGGDRNNDFHGLRISFAVQAIPPERDKPLGTADALYRGLKFMTEWKGSRFTVCNSDNLYSENAFRLMLRHEHSNAMVDYDRGALEFNLERVARFGVNSKDEEGFLTGIIEKPTMEEIESVKGKDGRIGVSMNIYDLQYDMILPFLEAVPLNPERQEKELPGAVTLMIESHPKSVFAYPLSEHVPDLSVKSDILVMRKYLERHYGNLVF